MAKKATARVPKKADVKKKATNKKMKSGRKWHMSPSPVFEPKSVVGYVYAAFEAADDHTIGENDLIAVVAKAGVKDDGKKTVKKLVKAVLRNMSRAGVIVKDRNRKKEEKAKSKEAKEEKSKKTDEAEDDEEEVVETPKTKKKIVSGKKTKK